MTPKVILGLYVHVTHQHTCVPTYKQPIHHTNAPKPRPHLRNETVHCGHWFAAYCVLPETTQMSCSGREDIHGFLRVFPVTGSLSLWPQLFSLGKSLLWVVFYGIQQRAHLGASPLRISYYSVRSLPGNVSWGSEIIITDRLCPRLEVPLAK